MTHPVPVLGFKVWYDGSGWIYNNGGIDTTTLTAGTLQVGDKLSMEYDFNGGSEVYRFKLNGVTLITNTTGTIEPLRDIGGVCNTTGDLIGDVFYEVTFSGCDTEFSVQTVTPSGTSATQGDPGTSEPFDVLAYQVFDRPDGTLEVEVMS